jgi:HSP20 family molecular chaperone IbpA
MSHARKPVRPVTELAYLQKEIDHLVLRLTELDRAERLSATEWSPNVDVYECHEQLVIVVEAPGLAPAELKIVCRNHQIIVSGERRPESPEQSIAFLCMERPHGRFSRTIPLHLALDVQHAEAVLESGLLTIAIPRLKERRRSEFVIPIRREEPHE